MIHLLFCAVLLGQGFAGPELPQPEYAITGTIVDEQQRPIAGAIVRLPGPSAANANRRSAVTGPDGRFRLVLDPNWKYILTIEAEGYASSCLMDAPVPSEHGTIVLGRGGQLVAKAAADSAGPGETLHLLPRGVSLPCPLPRHRFISALERQFASGAAEWEGLTPGRYELWRSVAEETGLPQFVQTVVVEAGERHVVIVPGPIGSTPAHAKWAMLLVPRNAAAAEKRQLFVTTSDPTAAKLTRKRAEAVADGENWLIRVPECRPGTMVRVEVPGWIGAHEFGSCDDTPTVTLTPAAEVRVRLLGDSKRGRRSPRSIVAEVSSCRSHEIEFRAAYEIGPDGVVSLAVPAGCVEPVVSPVGYAAISLGQQKLEQGEIAELGEKRLVEPGSALVRLVDGQTGAPLAGATVSAVPASERNRRLGPGDGVERLHVVRRAVTDEQGWARLSALPPGELAFLVRQGSYVEVSDVYRFGAGEDLIIDELTVGPAPTLRVSLPAKGHPEGLQDYRVVLSRADDQGWPLPVSPYALVRPGETVTFDRLTPGAWQVTVQMNIPGQPAARLTGTRVTLERGATETVSVDPPVAVDGRVTREGIGVKGVLVLRSTPRGPHIEAQTDDFGRFEALLPSEGEYYVDIRTDVSFNRLPRPVHFSGEELVEISLPSGSILGRVMTHQNEPVPRAAVQANLIADSAKDGWLAVKTGPDGRFEFHGVEPGTWRLAATDIKGSSGGVDARLAPGEKLRGLVIRVDEERQISGVAQFDHRAPAGNARVWVADEELGPVWKPAQTVTDSSGAFQLRVPAAWEGRRVGIITMSVDGTIAAHRAALTDGMTLVLPSRHAELRLRKRRGGWSSIAGRTLRLVGDEGVAIGPLIGGRNSITTDDSGETLVLRLAPGRWRYIESDDPEVRLQLLNGILPAAGWLFSVVLPPGGLQMIDVDEPRNGGTGE